MIYSLYSFPPPFFPGPRAKTFSRLLFSALPQQLVIPKGKIVVAKTRGDNHVENHWAASGIIVDALGQTLKSFTPNSQGDVVKTRSTIKPLHASILYGLKDRFSIVNNITPEEWAVLCSSHAGTDRHIKILEGLHSKFNLKESDLICGTHAPINQQSNERRLRDGKPLRNFHHQCSGHHTCLMILSKLLEYDYKDYWKLTGPLQQSLSKSLIKATGVKELKLTPYDGCNVPTISCNLKDYAVLYSKTVSKNQPLFDIVNLNADLIGDVDYLDPNLIKITNGRLFGKVGNDGLFVVVNNQNKQTMAIKLWSGEGDSSNELIEKLVIEALKQVQWLKLEEIAALEKIFPLNSSPHAKTGHQKVRYHVDDTLWG